MEFTKQTQRSLYAAVGAATWVVDRLRDTAGHVQTAWRQRDQWARRAGDTYAELAERGQTVVGRARRTTAHRLREVGDTARQVSRAAPAGGRGAEVTEAADLPIADFDSRNAADVIDALPGLSLDQLHQIERYEMRHRSRTTVLDRIDELRGDHEPWSGYDAMTVDEILPRMRSSAPAEQAAVASYEQRHRQRRSIIAAAPSHHVGRR